MLETDLKAVRSSLDHLSGLVASLVERAHSSDGVLKLLGQQVTVIAKDNGVQSERVEKLTASVDASQLSLESKMNSLSASFTDFCIGMNDTQRWITTVKTVVKALRKELGTVLLKLSVYCFLAFVIYKLFGQHTLDLLRAVLA